MVEALLRRAVGSTWEAVTHAGEAWGGKLAAFTISRSEYG
jgi:hypothetical protein